MQQRVLVMKTMTDRHTQTYLYADAKTAYEEMEKSPDDFHVRATAIMRFRLANCLNCLRQQAPRKTAPEAQASL